MISLFFASITLPGLIGAIFAFASGYRRAAMAFTTVWTLWSFSACFAPCEEALFWRVFMAPLALLMWVDMYIMYYRSENSENNEVV